eukprot:comp18457_c0_seq1/m.19751 comp18457_c0_seq1/g.19751  ORF comp18457_c0_seq1/g.19751 comp18457_c0_seq1/m.19751 type:complete len:476 (-) comp18457_c0_seq1:88-1515(-)
MYTYIPLLLCASTLALANPAQPAVGPNERRRFEFKHSLRGPFSLYQKNQLSFWRVGGSALVNENDVRVVPSAQNRRGYVWNVFPVNFTDWEVRAEFKIFGRSYGADGMAFWYATGNLTEGTSFGGPSQWNGLGIFVDTFDNDQKGDNPQIVAVFNDGKHTYDHSKDGESQDLGRCKAEIRNTQVPVVLTVRYRQHRLEITYDVHGASGPVQCVAKDNVVLPGGGHFAVSAATGALADDHDLHKFEVWNLSPKAKKEEDHVQVPHDELQGINEEELKKWEEEFQKQQAEIEALQKKYVEDHPNEAYDQNTVTDDFTKLASGQVQDLVRIVDLQKTVSKQVEANFVSVNYQLDLAVGAFQANFQYIQQKQQEYLLQLSNQPTAENLLAPRLNQLMGMLKKVQDRLTQLEHKMSQQQQATKEDLKARVQEDIQTIKQSVESEGSWTFMLVLLFVAQCMLFLVYLMWKRQTDSASKKFM